MRRLPYDPSIDELLADVFETGSARIEYRKLKLFFGAQRVSNSVWEELRERWDEIVARHGDQKWLLGKLTTGPAEDLNAGHVTFIRLDPEDTKAGESIWRPIPPYERSKSISKE